MSEHNKSIHKPPKNNCHRDLDLLIIYRNQSARSDKPQSSHLGLGVNAQHTLNVLRSLGFNVQARAAWEIDDLLRTLYTFNNNQPRICILEAPWVNIDNTIKLTNLFPNIHFIVRCHSNVAFLQVEESSVRLFRELLVHSETIPNLSVSANSLNFCRFIEKVYHTPCTYLPNLYGYDRVCTKNKYPFHECRGTLKAGSFGAIRLQKNHITGAAAALILAQELGTNLEFYITTNRTEGGGAGGVVRAIENLFTNLNWAKLICVPWAPWPVFRKTVAEMDVCFHLSCTETFSLVTADALAEGVVVIGSEVIDWLPQEWKVNLDDPFEAASVANKVIHYEKAGEVCYETLKFICEKNKSEWLEFLI